LKALYSYFELNNCISRKTKLFLSHVLAPEASACLQRAPGNGHAQLHLCLGLVHPALEKLEATASHCLTLGLQLIGLLLLCVVDEGGPEEDLGLGRAWLARVLVTPLGVAELKARPVDHFDKVLPVGAAANLLLVLALVLCEERLGVFVDQVFDVDQGHG